MINKSNDTDFLLKKTLQAKGRLHFSRYISKTICILLLLVFGAFYCSRIGYHSMTMRCAFVPVDL